MYACIRVGGFGALVWRSIQACPRLDVWLMLGYSSLLGLSRRIFELSIIKNRAYTRVFRRGFKYPRLKTRDSEERSGLARVISMLSSDSLDHWLLWMVDDSASTRGRLFRQMEHVRDERD